MNLSVYDSIAVSERFSEVLPGLSQVNLDITAGRTYRLTFDATITTGILKVYQGNQLIYSTDMVPTGVVNDIIHVTEKVFLDRMDSVVPFESITVSENVSFDIYYPISLYDSVTVSESKTLSI